MDFRLEELQALSSADVLRESIQIPLSTPRPFVLISLVLVFPLSVAVLAHTVVTHPIVLRLESPSAAASSDLALLFTYQFLYLLFLFTFSLLSTAAVVFTVASLYAAKPVSFSSSLSAVRPIFPRLFRTFLFAASLMLLYNLAFAVAVLTLIVAVPGAPDSALFLLLVIPLALAFLVAHVYISAIWHLASVVSVLEPLCGIAAIRKSRELLRGRARMAATFVFFYLFACGIIGLAFRAAVVLQPAEEEGLGLGLGLSPLARILVGATLVVILNFINLMGLLLQSVFYYVCKSYHHQEIDRSALYDHLGGYLGEYVPLKSSIQMENL